MISSKFFTLCGSGLYIHGSVLDFNQPTGNYIAQLQLIDLVNGQIADSESHTVFVQPCECFVPSTTNTTTTTIGPIGPLGVWVQRTNVSQFWSDIDSSSDGVKLVAIELNGKIYTSSDSGVTWIARENNRAWRSVASNSDGTKLAAAGSFPAQNIYVSSDSGLTWSARANVQNWSDIAINSDGSKLVATVSNGQIYTSADGGISWAARENNRRWSNVASNDIGNILIATVYPNFIFRSTNYGQTWTLISTIPDIRRITDIDMSSDGSKVIIGADGDGVNDDFVYTSADGGFTWTQRLYRGNWFGVAINNNGSKLVAIDYNVQTYISTNGGINWIQTSNGQSLYRVTMSSDGNKLAAVPFVGFIRTFNSGS